MNTGKSAVQSNNKMLTTIGYQINGEVFYALEGSVFVAGAAVQWLRDQLGIISSASEIESLAKTVKNNGGVTFIPSLAGLAAPYWDPHATGTIMGITRGTQKGHIARATLEAIAMRTKEIITAMEKDAKFKFKSLKTSFCVNLCKLLIIWLTSVHSRTKIAPLKWRSGRVVKGGRL